MCAEERAALIADLRSLLRDSETKVWMIGGVPLDPQPDRRHVELDVELTDGIIDALEAAGEEIATLEERLAQAERTMCFLLDIVQRFHDERPVAEEAYELATNQARAYLSSSVPPAEIEERYGRVPPPEAVLPLVDDTDLARRDPPHGY